MPDRTEPQIVRLGVLTRVEFDDLNPQEQVEVEATTAYLVRTYDVAAFVSDRERHRADIWFVYGVCTGRTATPIDRLPRARRVAREAGE
jgi:hypothetical protein